MQSLQRMLDTAEAERNGQRTPNLSKATLRPPSPDTVRLLDFGRLSLEGKRRAVELGALEAPVSPKSVVPRTPLGPAKRLLPTIHVKPSEQPCRG